MLKIDIGHITILPFRGLKKKADLFSFEHEPVICHYLDESGNDYLFYWVDFEDDAKRWLCIRVSKENLYLYLARGIMLRELILDQQLNSFIFVLNQVDNGYFKDGYLLENTQLPNEYLPNDESYYNYGVPLGYEDYLHEYSFLNKLKEKAFIFHLEPTTDIHGQSVVAADIAGNFLTNIAISGKEYIKYNTFKWFQNVIPSPAKLIDFTKKLSNLGTFQMPILRRASFEVGLAIDVTSMPNDYTLDFDWKKELIEGYKRDVLAVDYSNIEEAKEIVKKYDERTRKSIYSPFMKVISNPHMKISVVDHTGNFRRNYSAKRIKKEFRKIVVPDFEEQEDIIEKKLTLHKFVVAMEEGKDIKSFKSIKELTENLLFGEEQSEELYIIHSPFTFKETKYPLKREIVCNVTISQDSSIQIYHGELELIANGKSTDEVKDNFNTELGNLIEEHANLVMKNKFRKQPKFVELEKYLDMREIYPNVFLD